MLYSYTSEALDKTFYVVTDTPQDAIDLIQNHIKRYYGIDEDVEILSYDRYEVIEDRDL